MTAITRIQSFAFSGIEAVPVEVQVQISSGLPAFLVVGLPDKAVGEARERVRAALTAMGLALPPKRVLINLAPADLLKEGSHFDLPIALAVLGAMDVVSREDIGGYAALGELSLDGSLNPVAGVLPAAIGASGRELGLICAADQGGEAAWAGRIEVLAASSLLALINHFRGAQVLDPPEPAGVAVAGPGPDLADVETAKRALEIAAAGGHNLLLVGPPGAGKSMLAARLPGLLPDLTPREALETSMIHSVAGQLDGGRLVMRPPFREPHHSASQAALTGGGARAKPGEVSLAQLAALRPRGPSRDARGGRQGLSYVLAARLVGRRAPSVMIAHILPNVLGPVLVIAPISLGGAIITEATLSFLGVGLSPAQPSLGTLIRFGSAFLFSGEWWMAVFPGGALVLLIWSINLLGDRLGDLLNPRLR